MTHLVALILTCVVVAIVVGVALFHAFVTTVRQAFDGGAPGLWVASLREQLAFARIVSWNLGPRRAVDVDDVDPDADVVVVLVHGAAANGTCTTGWQRALEDAGVTVPVVAPDHGVVVRALEVHTARVADVVKRIRERAPRARLVFACHSMGGLVVRRLLAHDDDVRRATVGVVTVASPHEGTESLRALPFATSLAHLRRGHPSITSLPPLSSLVARSYVLGSAVDTIVYPKATTQPQGSEAFSFDDVGHAALLTEPAVAARVAALVKGLIDDARQDGVVDGA